VSLAGLFVAGLTLYGALARTAAKDRATIKADHQLLVTAVKEVRDEAKTDHHTLVTAIKEVRDEAKTDHQTAMTAVKELRDELVTKIDQNHAETIGRLSVLEQRTYDMAMRMDPHSPERHTG